MTDAVARRLGRGATVTTIERITALVIADPQVLAVATDDGRRWFTSRELHDIEERFVDVVTRRDTTERSIPACDGASPCGPRWAPTRPRRCPGSPRRASR